MFLRVMINIVAVVKNKSDGIDVNIFAILKNISFLTRLSENLYERRFHDRHYILSVKASGTVVPYLMYLESKKWIKLRGGL